MLVYETSFQAGRELSAWWSVSWLSIQNETNNTPFHPCKSSERSAPRHHRQWSVASGTSRWDGIPASPGLSFRPYPAGTTGACITNCEEDNIQSAAGSLSVIPWWLTISGENLKKKKFLSLPLFLSILNSLSRFVECNGNLCALLWAKRLKESRKLNCLNYQFNRIKIEKLPKYAATGATKFLVTLCLWFQALSMSFDPRIRFSVLTCGGCICCKIYISSCSRR